MLRLIIWILFSTFNNIHYDCRNTTMAQQGWEKVRIDGYYETQCKVCASYYTKQLARVVAKLGDYIDLYTYPYGNTKMLVYGDNVTFECPHGPAECYGNGLHACVIYYLPEKSFYVPFNACLMLWGSTEDAADQCSNNEIIASVIKTCAKGQHVTELLKSYARETAKLGRKKTIPYTLVNGKALQPHERLMANVCDAFENPPEPCKRFSFH